MIYPVLSLWFMAFIVGFLPRRIRFTCPILAIILLFTPLRFNLHSWPCGIVYKLSLSIPWLYLCITSALFGSYIIYCNPRLSIGVLAILTGVFQISGTLDWFNLYVAFEILLVGFMFCAVATKWRDRYAYLEVHILGTTLILIGVTRFYAINGHMGITGKSGSILLLIGLLLKSSMWPFDNLLRIYDSLDRKLYWFATALICKVSIYYLSLLGLSSDLYTTICICNLLRSTYLVASSKSTKTYRRAFVLHSNSVTIALFLQPVPGLQVVYLIYFAILQALFCSRATFLRVLCISSFPLLSPGFVLKVLICRSLNQPLITIAILCSNAVFTVRALSIIIRMFSKSRSDTIIPELKQ